jgi:hypothetical protein
VQRLEALYQERNLTEAKQHKIGRNGAEHKKRGPDVEEVCRFWRRMPELWDSATDEEKTTLMQAVVFRVEMPEKEKGACDIALASQAPVHWLELNSHMGAGVGLEPVNSAVFVTLLSRPPCPQGDFSLLPYQLFLMTRQHLQSVGRIRLIRKR